MDKQPSIVKELKREEEKGKLTNADQKEKIKKQGLSKKQLNIDFLENANDLIQAVNPDGTILYVNKAWKETLEYNDEEIKDLNIFEVIHPDSKKHCKKIFRKLLQGEEFEKVKASFISKNGKKIEVEGNINCRFENGEPAYTRGIFRDITERKEKNKKLKNRLEFEELISDISTNFINTKMEEINEGIDNALARIGKFVGADRSYIFRFYDNNNKMENTNEWCAKNIKPQIDKLKNLKTDKFPWWMKKLYRFEDIHIPSLEDLPAEANSEKKILQEQNIKSLVVVPMIHNKSLVGFIGFDFVRNKKKWSKKDVKLLRLVGEIFVNSLEYKKAEKEKKDILDAAADGIRIVDKNFKVKKMNQTIAEMTDIPKEKGEGMTCYKMFKAEGICKTQECSLKKVLQTGEGFTREHTRKTPDGKEIPCLDVVTPYRDEKGNILGIIEDFRDITDIKETQERLREKVKELKRYKKVTIGRELRMKELKKKIKKLKEE